MSSLLVSGTEKILDMAASLENHPSVASVHVEYLDPDDTSGPVSYIDVTGKNGTTKTWLNDNVSYERQTWKQP